MFKDYKKETISKFSVGLTDFKLCTRLTGKSVNTLVSKIPQLKQVR